jgi:hypothetical protein
MSDGYSADSQIREINMLRRKVERIEAERDELKRQLAVSQTGHAAAVTELIKLASERNDLKKQQQATELAELKAREARANASSYHHFRSVLP